MTFDVRDKGIQHQHFFKNDHIFDTFILVTKFDTHRSRYNILHVFILFFYKFVLKYAYLK